MIIWKAKDCGFCDLETLLRSGGDALVLELETHAYDLIHAGLIFEYLDWAALLPRIARALKPSGVLSVVLQTPSASSPAVTETTFTSLRSLASAFRFVDAEALVTAARVGGLALDTRRIEPLPAGKSFDVLRFTKNADSTCTARRT